MSVHLCTDPDCNFMVMLTPSGWAHVDTHGVPTNHTAWPSHLPRPEEDPMPADLPEQVIANLSSEQDTETAMMEAAAARVRSEAEEMIAAIAVARVGDPLTTESAFVYTRTVPDLEIAGADYWAGWSDAEDHIARMLGWTIQEAPGG